MNTAYLDLVATAGAAAITHLGLVDETGTELTGGTPAYARLAVTWAAADDGLIRPTTDLDFDVPVGDVAGWRGYSASSGGTDYGGGPLSQAWEFTLPGTFRLLAAEVGIRHQAGG